MKSFIFEISCPYDAFVNTCYNIDFAYYQLLNELINVATPYSCKTFVLIIGSLGTIHNKLTSGLKCWVSQSGIVSQSPNMFW